MRLSLFWKPRFLAFVGWVCLEGSAISGADSIASVERAAATWAQLRGETARIESDWKWQRETLESSITALRERVRQLEQNRDLLQSTIAADAAKADSLAPKTAQSHEALALADTRVKAIAESLTAMRPWLPPRLSLALDLPYRSLADASLGTAERLQYAMTIFNRCALFNKGITFGEEPVNVGGNSGARLLEVIYWGMSHAYALDRASNTAYFGHPGKDGWTWEARPEAAEAVARAVAICRDKDEPAFVELPVQVSDPFPAATATAAGK